MIREATISDVDASMPLLKRCYDEHIQHTGLRYDHKSMRQTAERLAEHGVSVLHEGEKIDAILCAVLYPSMFDSKQIVAHMIMWYTEAPKGTGIQLLKKFEELARNKGATIFLFNGREDKCYEKLGYVYCETQYIKSKQYEIRRKKNI